MPMLSKRLFEYPILDCLEADFSLKRKESILSVGINFRFAKSETNFKDITKFPGIPRQLRGKWTKNWIVPSIFHVSCKEIARII